LTLVADRSSSQEARDLVHKVRINFNTSLAAEPNIKQSFWLQVKGWLAFQTLSKACAASGYSIVNRGFAVQPSAHEACRDFAAVYAIINSKPGPSAKQLGTRQFLTKIATIINKALFNGLNAQDQQISYDTYRFGAIFGEGISSGSRPGARFNWEMESAERALQQDCQSRRFWPSAT
jgi:hypothetical protein